MSENQKKIWITGASTGIGKAVAEKFSKEGWKVAISARRGELLKNIAQDNNIFDYPLDVTDEKKVAEVFKKILEDFKNKFHSPYVGNDVIEMNSIISKYIAAATFDSQNADLIDLLFKRVHTLKSHTLLDKSLSTTFCELEKYFQNKNEVLIGIIDYDFDKSRYRKIKNISINPEQRKQINLDEGDRLITIANFNDLEMVKHSRYLHIL